MQQVFILSYSISTSKSQHQQIKNCEKKIKNYFEDKKIEKHLKERILQISSEKKLKL